MMRKAMLITLMLSLLMCQILCIFGKVTVLRGPLTYSNLKGYALRELICTSDDDGSALVWNSNLYVANYSKVFTAREPDTRFKDATKSNSTGIDCKMKKENCVLSWDMRYWHFTNSLYTPMGPVLDQRWEEFAEFKNNIEDIGFLYRVIHLKNLNATKFSFSVRVSSDVYILLCNSKRDYNKDFCYWIIIGGWYNSKSIIRKCVTGVSEFHPHRNSECSKAQIELIHAPLSANEWRTFIISWNVTRGNIYVYDTDNVIMSYEDKQYPQDSNVDYYAFIRHSNNMLLRFHIYDFFHTTEKNAIITSPEFVITGKAICIRLLVGLCTECVAEVVLRDDQTKEILEKIKAEGLSTSHGLPMWQFVKIEKSFSENKYIKAKIQLIPTLKSQSSNPLWTIADVHQCPPNGSLRNVLLTVNDNIDITNVTCQKLFYKEDTIVNSKPNSKLNMELDITECPVGYVGPNCSASCTTDLNSDLTCKGIAICYKNGCTCSPGFSGSECYEFCNSDTYGFGCKKKCGFCFHETSCDKISGKCDNGCKKYTDKLYIPPLCQIDIGKPDTPKINYTSKTSIQVVVPLTWKEEYRKAEIFYSFIIQQRDEMINQTKKHRVFQNMSQIIGYFDDLQPATSYKIMCRLSIGPSDEQIIDSEWQNADTNCDTLDFEITPEESELRINWSVNANQLYPCPKDWYHLIVKNTEKDKIIYNSSIAHRLNLEPDTRYEVTISVKYVHVILFRKIRTLESVPSKVLNLQTRMSTPTEVILFWNAPDKPNGKILHYVVTLKVEVYYGCEDLNLPTPNNLIFIQTIQWGLKTWTLNTAISKLHPYTYYRVQIKARNSRNEGESVETVFSTLATDIPVAIFSQLKFQDWKLSWDPPEDCTTILGPIYGAKIKIRGISYGVRDFVNITTTKNYFLDLAEIEKIHGVERYAATIFVIRNETGQENNSAYQEIAFDTLAKAPPMVNNLDVVEVDIQADRNMTIHLRWQSPSPPLNGKLLHYSIISCNFRKECKNMRVELHEYCDLWDDYICKVIQTSYRDIQVIAYNVNVTNSGTPVYVTEKMLTNTIPDAPRNYTYTFCDNGIVDLKWLQPWKTGNHLDYFLIHIEEVSSNLRMLPSLSEAETFRHAATNYSRDYSRQLHLLPSTNYKISFRSVTIANTNSSVESVKFQTPPAVNFSSNLEFDVYVSNTTILMNIPQVQNDVRNSILHVIVKGSNPCKPFTKLSKSLSMELGLKNHDIAWQAAVVSTEKLSGQKFTIGDNNIHGNGTNCPLKFGEIYEIIVIITEKNKFHESIVLAKIFGSVRNSIDKRPSNHEVWLIPIILFIAATITFYFCPRKRSINRQMQKDVKSLAHYNSNRENNWEQNLSGAIETEFLTTTTTREMQQNNMQNKKKTSLVKVEDFENYVRRAIQSGLLDKQYKTIPIGQTRPWNYGKLPQNESKNRYKNLIAYDDTRLILEKLPNDPYSDYINANYITGYKKKHRYIATQGPKPNTVNDFWRMIWQEKVLVICMLANVVENGKTKCEKYWPDIDKTKTYDDVIVLNVQHSVFADYTFRTLHVTCGEETRKVEHLHYTAWPDHDVPFYTHSIVMYLKKVSSSSPGEGSIVVHCSDGVGRTGTIVLCDICLHQASAEGVLDVFAETTSINRDRPNMVSNRRQYLFAHLALVDCLLSIPTTLPCNEMLPMRIEEFKKQLSVQQQRLQNTAWKHEALYKTFPLSLSKRNQAKNRFPELVSDKIKINRLYLKRYPLSDEDSDYLSGVYVDGVKLRNQYLATQLPMPSTLNDFWRMVAEFKVELLIMLQPPDLQDPTCCSVAPLNGEFKPTPFLKIIAKEIVEWENYTSQKVILVDNSEKTSREKYITILCCTEWNSGKNQSPPSVESMVTFWQAAEKISRGEGPTVTLCHDGVTGCGLYLALSFLLERMTVERECDVCLAVRAIRSRPDFVNSLEHLDYLYDAAAIYFKSFEGYANLL